MIPAWAHYRASDDLDQSCGTCAFFVQGLCEMFDETPVASEGVCDEWSMWIKKADLTAAGLAVRAADTGRVLLIQRSSADSSDPAAGTWEFPGGILNDGEHPYDGAKREWQEEMGVRVPKGIHVGSWRSGVYQGYIHEIPKESAVKINRDPEDRRVLNPDDPDGDDVEVAAWWDPNHLKRFSALRPELRTARPWEKVAKGEANPVEVALRVHGVSRAPSGAMSYRMESRDGFYVGRTNPTKVKARKGDILKVQVGDLTCNPNGDIQWLNPNVMALANDALSWKDLGLLAAGEISKDSAPGPAGNVPATDNSGPTGGMPSQETLGAVGPTVSSVHVNRPLKNISVGYMGRKKDLRITKADRKKQLVYGVVLEPNSLDTQDDYMLPDQVEKAAHTYMGKVAKGKASVSKLQHRTQGFFKNKPGVTPVESFIAPVDFSYDGKEMVKKGTWVMVLHVENQDVWDKVMNGEYTGLSIGGTGVRQPATGGLGMFV